MLEGNCQEARLALVYDCMRSRCTEQIGQCSMTCSQAHLSLFALVNDGAQYFVAEACRLYRVGQLCCRDQQYTASLRVMQSYLLKQDAKAR